MQGRRQLFMASCKANAAVHCPGQDKLITFTTSSMHLFQLARTACLSCAQRAALS